MAAPRLENTDREIKRVPVRVEPTDGDTGGGPTKHTPDGGRVTLTKNDESFTAIASMYSIDSKSDIFELYAVGVEDAEEKESVPFVHTVSLQGPKGERVRVKAIVDNGAMCGALDSDVYNSVSTRLSTLLPSTRVLRVANGTLVPSQGIWRGTIDFAGIRRLGQFEVFPSGGAWAMLFGKPLLESFKMAHDYSCDEITAPMLNGTIIKVPNQYGRTRDTKDAKIRGISMVTDIKQRKMTNRYLAQLGTFTNKLEQIVTIIQNPTLTVKNLSVESSSQKGVHPSASPQLPVTITDKQSFNTDRKYRTTIEELPEEDIPQYADAEPTIGETPQPRKTTANRTDRKNLWQLHRRSRNKHRWIEPTIPHNKHEPFSVFLTEDASTSDPGTEQPDIEPGGDTSLLTRQTDPFKPERVSKIVELVEIGDDVDKKEKAIIQEIIAKYADIFALSISEVTPVKGAVHTLNVPKGKTFGRKIHQRPLKALEREYFFPRLDEMEACGVIRKIDPADVKCCSPTTLAQKAHSSGGLTLLEIQHRLNDACDAEGIPREFPDLPQREPAAASTTKEEKTAKYRICQNFGELNKVTQVAPMPQGDIRTKQQALCGERWVSIFDFAAGFYAVEVDKDSQPYTSFYVEGRGYYCYQKMPFGLTGAPSTFAKMTADALGDMVGRAIQLFVDDGGMAGSDFETKLTNLEALFTRCRATGLSLSAQKTKLFQSEVVFAGERVGKTGIRGDLTKLTAVVSWERPTNIQNLASFLGLTGYFRTLVKGYAKLAKPLKDLENELIMPKQGGRQAYRRAAVGHSLVHRWTHKHEVAFIKLKSALVSDPVVKAPVFDGRGFIVTTDGCKDGLGGVLSQRFTTTSEDGKTITRIHPVAFASKRTSSSEEKYKPYLLEFAALKFSLDKFDDVIYGSPIEIETDCQALRDTLLNDKINSTHARWRDGVLAHHIVDVRHRPGINNGAADGLSRKYTNTPKEDGDGHQDTVSPDWETTTGLIHDVFSTGDMEEDAGGWMCQYGGTPRMKGDGHEWTVDADVARTDTKPHNLFNVSPTTEFSNLRTRFANEPIFLQVIDALLNLDHGKTVREKRRARHRALGYMIDEGKLWRLGDGRTTRARPRLECVSQQEAIELARTQHNDHGHWGRDLIKIQLLDHICSPRLEKSITKAILDCAQCKAFGGAHTFSLFQPITRRHPLELVVADYLAVPKGKGGYMEISLFMDVFSQRVWGFKHKTHGTAKTTMAGLAHICREFRPPEAFMTDGGSPFNNNAVRGMCAQHGIKYQVVAAYSPWINGLLEGTNGKLLGRLKRMCAPELGEDDWAAITKFEDLPKNWPDHFDEALSSLNNRILPALKYSPTEILTGNVINTPPTNTTLAASPPSTTDVADHIMHAHQQQLDTHSHAVQHANEREVAFNSKITDSRLKTTITFKVNDLVQIYRNDLDYTFRTNRKLLPKWGAVRRVVSRDVNAYKLATLEGLILKGRFSARRLRRFVPRAGTNLEAEQAAIVAATNLIRKMAGITEEEAEDVPEDGMEEEPDQQDDGEADESTSEIDRSPEEEEEEDGAGDDAEMADDGMAQGGWATPGRLRMRS